MALQAPYRKLSSTSTSARTVGGMKVVSLGLDTQPFKACLPKVKIQTVAVLCVVAAAGLAACASGRGGTGSAPGTSASSPTPSGTSASASGLPVGCPLSARDPAIAARVAVSRDIGW
jgi:hypothetical protein